MFLCLSGYAFGPLTTLGMKLGMVVGGEGRLFQKVRSNFKLLGLSSNLMRVTLDQGRVQNAYRGGCPPRSNEVKSQVKFQVAQIELRLGEDDARPRASAKCISRRMLSEVKQGQRSGQISSSSDGT